MELATGGDLLSYLRNQKLRHEQYVSVAPDGTVSEQKVLQVTTHSDLMLFAWHIARGMSHLESVKVCRAPGVLSPLFSFCAASFTTCMIFVPTSESTITLYCLQLS